MIVELEHNKIPSSVEQACWGNDMASKEIISDLSWKLETQEKLYSAQAREMKIMCLRVMAAEKSMDERLLSLTTAINLGDGENTLINLLAAAQSRMDNAIVEHRLVGEQLSSMTRKYKKLQLAKSEEKLAAGLVKTNGSPAVDVLTAIKRLGLIDNCISMDSVITQPYKHPEDSTVKLDKRRGSLESECLLAKDCNDLKEAILLQEGPLKLSNLYACNDTIVDKLEWSIGTIYKDFKFGIFKFVSTEEVVISSSISSFNAGLYHYLRILILAFFSALLFVTLSLLYFLLFGKMPLEIWFQISQLLAITLIIIVYLGP